MMKKPIPGFPFSVIAVPAGNERSLMAAANCFTSRFDRSENSGTCLIACSTSAMGERYTEADPATRPAAAAAGSDRRGQGNGAPPVTEGHDEARTAVVVDG